jgi:transcriptional regulator with XRE-family HTH domain
MDDKPLRPADIRLGATIRELRLRSRFTTAELADAIGISEPMVSAIERGRRRATPEVCAAIATEVRAPLNAIIEPAPAEQVA